MARNANPSSAFNIAPTPRGADSRSVRKAGAKRWQLNCVVDERIHTPLKVAAAHRRLSIGDMLQPLIVDMLVEGGFMDEDTRKAIELSSRRLY